MAERATRGFKPFQKGDKVWLNGKNLKIGYPHRKLAPLQEGPFEITEVLGPVTYRLKLPAQWRIHNVFHACYLSPFTETLAHGPNFTRPPPDLIEGEEEWDVEAIVRHRGTGKRRRYRVKWKGYPPSDNTWEPEEAFKNTEEMLQNYKQRNHL
jgi:hypothetical protein